MKVARIYIFGDSLVAGTYDTQGGWADRLKRDMHAITLAATDGTKRQLYNLGIGGETSRRLIKRIRPELAARHTPAWPAIVVIGIGKNDSRLTADGTPEVPIEEFEANLRDAVSAAREVTDRVLGIGMGPCAQDEQSFKDQTYTRERLKAYNQVAMRVYQEIGVPVVDVHDQLLAAGPDVFYRDGLHLSDAGYQILYDAIKPQVLRLIED